MYKHVFIPTKENHTIPSVAIPSEWYGNEVGIIVFPIKQTDNGSKEKNLRELCGAWKSDKSAEKIISLIYNDRTSGKTRILEEL